MRQRLSQVRQLSGQNWRTLTLRALLFAVVWIAVALPISTAIFMNSSKSTVIASHDAVVRPTLDGYATLDLGPYVPNIRYPSSSRLGAQVDLGKTNLTTYTALIDRYAFIGSQPGGQTAKLRATLVGMALDSAVLGGLIALTVPGTWILLGRRRREELAHQVTPATAAVACLTTVAVAVLAAEPWTWNDDDFTQGIVWQSIDEALPDVPIPAQARRIEVEGGLMTSGTKDLAESAFDSYRRSLSFYRDVYVKATELGPRLHQPAEDETVVLLVSDRHDNVGMDKVARAVADAGGATALFDAGDDTSTGSTWEAFSLESLDEAFQDFDERYSIAGNHDHGDFVPRYLDELGFTTLNGEVIDGPGGSRLLGVDDPRSSGLGSSREATGVSFDEQSAQLAALACEHEADGDRINTLIVHDANSGLEALERGCVDLVLAGHLHSQLGPTRETGENDRPGYTYTNGTTGGAAYALAIGSKLRRDAQVTLVTYRDGRPVGIQPVTVGTIGDLRVGSYTQLDLGETPVITPPTGGPGPNAQNGPSAEESP